jgi:hypothetical protein
MKLSILYAYRNREPQRIQNSLTSLQKQHKSSADFEVIFVDYGSTEDFQKPIQKVVDSYSFANYYYVGHEGLLWCKARALNFGIQKAKCDRIFIADADVVFNKDFLKHIKSLDVQDSFYLFDIAYLDKKLKPENVLSIPFENRKHSHIHETFGVGLFNKQALEKVNGLDAFFHFYGSEDEDLNRRLQNLDYHKKKFYGLWLQHIWHERYPKPKDVILTKEPRLSQIMRINQQHMMLNDQRKVTFTSRGIVNITYYKKTDLERLNQVTTLYVIPNKKASVDMWLYLHIDEVIKQYKVVKFEFVSDRAPTTLKYKVKKKLSKPVQQYYTMKEVNDLLLRQIIFKWHDFNYKLEVVPECEKIVFVLESKAE